MDKAQREDLIETQNEALKEAQNIMADQPILVEDTMKHMHAQKYLKLNHLESSQKGKENHLKSSDNSD
ncbi:88_t:CDS:2 [Gigaspora margarita]|uniref:88_t:CDS:1 n=1 Tax=Gigaspora margarita TaxID=4874 RepID=A0ABN7UE43_GIGMA|nr:88_t:CDS:2 [Gigaspora margarita]